MAGGQFLQWRFLRRGLWWQAHPYSLSAAPAGDELRITVKDLGDHSAHLARMRPGTRVAIEGPYGAFTADTAQSRRLLLVGAGVGTAPILALLQELPEGTDVTVLLRASTRAGLAPIVLTATVAGTAGGLAFHPHSPVVRPATATAAPSAPVKNDLPGCQNDHSQP